MYKLFLFGDKQLFALVQIPADMNLKEGDIFWYKGLKYKILRHIRIAFELQYDEQGRMKNLHEPGKTDKERNEQIQFPELIITEIPEL